MLIGMIAALSALTASGLCLCWGGFQSLNWLWQLPLSFVGAFVLLLGLAFFFLWFMCHIVRKDVPQEKDSAFYRQMAYLYIDAVITFTQVRVRTKGLEKTPKDGRFLLVCNHLNDADPGILLSYFKKSQLAFVSKQENRDMFIVGSIMHKTMCQLINRDNDREALKSILKCIQMIKDDQVSVAVFPEGGIKKNNLLNPFRPGVFKIAQKAQVPIVVCTIWGTQEVFHNIPKLKPTDVELHLVGVIPAEDLVGRTTVDISEQVHRMMAEDLGPDRVYHEQK